MAVQKAALFSDFVFHASDSYAYFRFWKTVLLGRLTYEITSGPVFSCKLRYIVGFILVEMAISTNPKPTIYNNLYKNADWPIESETWSVSVQCIHIIPRLNTNRRHSVSENQDDSASLGGRRHHVRSRHLRAKHLLVILIDFGVWSWLFIRQAVSISTSPPWHCLTG